MQVKMGRATGLKRKEKEKKEKQENPQNFKVAVLTGK